MRSGGVLAGRSSGKSHFGLPEPPAWGGLGPLAWRPSISLLRNLRGGIVFLGMFILFGGGPGFIRSDGQGKSIILVFIPTMTLFMLPRLTFDFCGDIEPM